MITTAGRPPSGKPPRWAGRSEQQAGQGAAGLADPRVPGREHVEQPDQVHPGALPVLPEVRRMVPSIRSKPSVGAPGGHVEIGHPGLRVDVRRDARPRPAAPAPRRRSSPGGSGPPGPGPWRPPGGPGWPPAPAGTRRPRRPGHRAPWPAGPPRRPGRPARPGRARRACPARRPAGRFPADRRPPHPPRRRAGQPELLGELHDLAEPLAYLGLRHGAEEPSTTWPPTTAITIGMLCTCSAARSCGFASMSTLASTQSPSASMASFSSTGLSCLQGSHHSAQRSRMTGTERDRSTHV